VALSPDGKRLAQGYPWWYGLHLWEVESGKELLRQPGHTGPVSRIVFAPDGRTLVSRSEQEKALRFWEMATGTEFRVLTTDMPEPRADAGWGPAIAYSPDGRLVALGDHGGIVRVWEASTGKEVRRLEIDIACRAINALAFSPDGRTLAVSGARAMYHNTPWPGCITVFDLSNGATALQQPLPCTPTSSVFALDNRFLAFADDSNGLCLWDLSRNRSVLRLEHPVHVFGIAYSRDGRFIATAAGAQVRLWELASGKEALRLEADAWHVCLSPNGLLATSAANSIRVWDLATEKEIAQWPGQLAPCTCLAFAPGGDRLAAGFADTTTLVWDLAKARRPAARTLPPADLERLWETLASADAAKAYGAVRTMLASDKAVAFLMVHLSAAGNERLKRLPELLTDFDSPVFSTRQAASKEVANFLPDAELPLRKVLAGNPSPEQRRRIEALLALPTVVRDPETLRGLRAVMVLECAGTPEAAAVLERLAQGAADACLTQEAKAAFERLKKK
jgi:hypothetical protein